MFMRAGRRFGTRLAGYAKSCKVWTCLKCRAWHETKKPLRCTLCQHHEFLHYDSAGEARWFVGLMRQQDEDELVDLEHHPRFPIYVTGPGGLHHVCDYVADASFVRSADLEAIVADFKPRAAEGLDPVFKLKQKLFEAQYGMKITIYTER